MRRLGVWLLVCTWVGVGVSVPEDGEGLRAGTLTCLTNNILRIDCHWSAPELGRGPSPWLLFTSNQAPDTKHRCVFWARTCTVVLPQDEVITPFDNFTITLHRHVSGKEQVSLVDPQYLPRRHVKLDPPSDLQSNVSSDACVLSWSVGPALEPLASLLSYELAFKRQDQAWEQARHKDHIAGVTWLLLEAVELDPGSIYEARLRVQMATLDDVFMEEERYEGQWSEWSQSVSCPSPQRPGSHVQLTTLPWRSEVCMEDTNSHQTWAFQELAVSGYGCDSGPFLLTGALTPPLGHPNSTLVAVSTFLLLSCLTYLLFKLLPRVKRTFYQHVPSPVAFFQPLYSVHNGNFQAWTGAHRAGVQLSQECVGAPQVASKASVREAIALLTYDSADAWPPVALEKEEEGTGTGLPTDVLPADLEWGGPPPAYLPQEEWGPASSARLAALHSEGSSSDYCALGYYGGCQPLTFPGNTLSSGPILAFACGPSCNEQSLDAWQGGSCVGAGHSQRQDPGDQAA